MVLASSPEHGFVLSDFHLFLARLYKSTGKAACKCTSPGVGVGVAQMLIWLKSSFLKSSVSPYKEHMDSVKAFRTLQLLNV